MIKNYKNDLTKKRYLQLTNSKWKARGIIFKDNEDKNYWSNKYYNSSKCELCNKSFVYTKDRHLDHNHLTGEPRNIVCQKCNNGKIDRKVNSNNKYSKNIYYNNHAKKYIFDKKLENIRILRRDNNLNKLKWIKFSILLMNKDKLFT